MMTVVNELGESFEHDLIGIVIELNLCVRLEKARVCIRHDVVSISTYSLAPILTDGAELNGNSKNHDI